jgi:type IV pilus assembly protein PilM
MIKIPFGGSGKSFLGIDIGTASIKIVELSKRGERKILENYGEISTHEVGEKPFRTGFSPENNSFSLSAREISQGISAILSEAKINSRLATFSIPDFSSFFTTIELPAMTREELPQAVHFEARQHIPLPLSEVVLDWSVIGGETVDSQGSPLKIILVAVPKEVINQYQEISRLCGLQLLALEAEVFGLLRALIKEDKKVIILVDIGAQSTTVSVIENKVLKTSHSFDIGGNDLSQSLSQGLQIDFLKTEEMKKKYGLTAGAEAPSGQKSVSQILLPRVNLMITEIEQISQKFYQKEGKEIETIILAGGTALLPGLREYLTSQLRKEVIIGDPFSEIISPAILAPVLKEIGPSYAIAVGMALRGLD